MLVTSILNLTIQGLKIFFKNLLNSVKKQNLILPFPGSGKKGFPGNSLVKNPPANAGDGRDISLTPESERSPGEGHGNPLQYSCLENSVDRGAWWATVRGVAKSQTQLNNWT